MATYFTDGQVMRRAIYLMEQMMPWGSDVSIEADDEGNILVVGEREKIMDVQAASDLQSFLAKNEGKVLFQCGYTAECSDHQRPFFVILAQGEPR